MRDKILIYCDYGCSNIGQLKSVLSSYFEPKGILVSETDAHQIIKEHLLDTDVLAFVLPGGAATPYRQKLSVQGNEAIRNYVMQGGIYFGVCAGAYYACQKVFFEVDVPQLKIVNECGLDLVNADAIGTLHREFGIQPYTQDASAETIIPLRWCSDNTEHWVHYHGGPYFSNLEKEVQVLAVYDSLDPKQPAIIEKKYGQGRMILSGVHFENTPESLLQRIYKNKSDEQQARQNASDLQKKEITRQELVRKLLGRIR